MSQLSAVKPKSNHRGVNSLLHTLRGEQFRQSQNLQRSRAHVSATISRHSPTLPIDFNSPDYIFAEPIPAGAIDSHTSAYKTCPGPEPPKSWTLTPKEVVEETPAWRACAMSLVLPDAPPVPLLTNLCLRVLASLPAQEFEDAIPHVSPHLRRDLIRHSAVHSPLPSAKLYALCEPDGHADTELIVIGPNASLRDSYFIRTTDQTNVGSGSEAEDDSWDSDKFDPDPVNTLVLVSTRLATSTLLSLPPTITRMALINLSTPIPLHRLPGTCPLLIILDLSYNTWLGAGAEKILERVEWSRWNRLRVLGLRECLVSSEMLIKINKGRWDDVQVIQ